MFMIVIAKSDLFFNGNLTVVQSSEKYFDFLGDYDEM